MKSRGPAMTVSHRQQISNRYLHLIDNQLPTQYYPRVGFHGTTEHSTAVNSSLQLVNSASYPPCSIFSRNKEPNSLDYITWLPVWPYLGVDGSFSGKDVGFRGSNTPSTLVYLPEHIEGQVDRDTNVAVNSQQLPICLITARVVILDCKINGRYLRSDKILNIPISLCKNFPAVENDDDDKKRERDPGCVGLEAASEWDLGIPINALSFQGLQKVQVGYKYRYPG